MSSTEKDRIVSAIRCWVRIHPNPDVPVIDIGPLPEPRSDGGGLSPRQIYNIIQEDSEIGRWLLRVIEAGIERTSLEEILDGFRVVK